MKSIRPYLIILFLAIVAIILLSNKLIIWGTGVLAAALIILGIQQLIRLNVKVSLFEESIKSLDEKNNSLEIRNKKLIEENSFLKERHFQITQVRSILELNLFEIDTKFTRSINNQDKINERNIKYFGSLSVSLKAKYGVDLKELRFRYDPSEDTLTVAEINPRFISFGTRKIEWDFFEIYEYRGQNILADKQWMTSDKLHEYAGVLKEKYRTEVESSLEKGPEEFEWIHTPVRQNVVNAVKVLFKGLCSNIEVTDTAGEGFVQLEKLSFELPADRGKLTD